MWDDILSSVVINGNIPPFHYLCRPTVRCRSVFCVQVVQRYDILLIQEVRDISETAIDTLVDAVNTDIG